MTATNPTWLPSADEEDTPDVTPMPSSVRRYRPNRQQVPPKQGVHYSIPLRSGRLASSPASPSAPPPQRRMRPHWLFWLGIGLLVMLAGWLALNTLLCWWQVTQDDWHYGRPRTFQVDAVVGHQDSTARPSHFLALNLNRHILIIELPGGDPSQARIYVGPVLTGDGQELAPVTLSFRDVNGDGKPDMIVAVQGSRFVYVNDQGSFRPARPGEVRATISYSLDHHPR